MVDPDKAMALYETNGVKYNINDYEASSLVGALVRLAQYQAVALDDATKDRAWRVALYREVFEDLTQHSQEGTGSKAEGDMLKATSLLAAILGVRNL